MQQSSELQLLVSFCCLTYAFQSAWPALPPLRPARVELVRVLLLESPSGVRASQRPSLNDLLRPSLAFVRPLRWYYAAVRLPAAVHVGLMAHRFLPPIRQHQAADGNRVSRFSRVKFPYMRGVCDSAVPVLESPLRGESNTLAITRAPVLPSGCLDTVGATDFGYFGAHQLQGYPA